MSLKIYNTLTRKKEEFKPLDPDHVKMYVCGPTVYNYAHVGNARPVVVFDLLARLLRHDYPRLTYARNITDIDDKIIAAAQETGEDISAITEKYTRIYEEDMGALNAELPDERPKATQYIPQMIHMVETLIEKGHAYEADGHVLFNVPSMENYGELSNRTLDELIAGARVEVASYKKDPTDFVLWKPSTPDQPGWDSPWGRGRPGWHLECSCMIEDVLGETIDIHGGGLDLIFPHHENEIAQSRCAHGGAPLANYWMHNGYLTVEGEKMSKSLGNFITVHELLEEGVKGEAIRMALLSAHYRQPLDFSRSGIEQAKKQLDRWYRLTEGVEASDADIPEEFLEALRDDLNTPKAIAVLNALAKEEKASALKAAANLFGLLLDPDWFKVEVAEGAISDEDIQKLIEERAEAKKNKDFGRADGIRDELAAEGVILKDGPDGTTWERQ
ncbi:cysteine--tRNA ligase [Emcibacter nanhaiensis]|uniref:Cysteine--tRNA ligase n=1 Tax=Emcibacter nanhaiensis TaxID=1505037 RepID=A0A501PAA5_9PROT|nr:cysteine--tRNA ligase [Emcibacter nanhaiensis]TPD57300.1 cysteine--tRNA ligase [Emcibacter nanhaiensis]